MESSLRDTVTEGHPVGYSGGTNQYRCGGPTPRRSHVWAAGRVAHLRARRSPPDRTTPPARRRGVAVGNYAEEVLSSDFAGRPGFVLDRGGAFEVGEAAAGRLARRAAIELPPSQLFI